MGYDPDNCGGEGGDWIVAGWWTVALGETVHAFNTPNRYFGYYAEGEDGVVWSGNLARVELLREGFYRCKGRGSTASSESVRMRLGDIGDADRIIENFT